jgi:hypothetical protein
MKEITFNEIKQNIHLKKVRYIATRADKPEYKKEKEVNKLTFYKDYKAKMIWLTGYGIALETAKFFEVEPAKKYIIKTGLGTTGVEVL